MMGSRMTSRRCVTRNPSVDGSRATTASLHKPAMPRRTLISRTSLQRNFESGGRRRIMDIAWPFDLPHRHRRMVALAIERHANDHPRALADPAAHLDVAAMEPRQSFDDGESEPAAVAAARVGAAHLEDRIAEPAEMLGRDPDAGVRDRHHEALSLNPGIDRHRAAAVRE